jgi:hypothetical protein
MQLRHLAARPRHLLRISAATILFIGMSVQAFAGENPKPKEAAKPQKPARASGFEAIGLPHYVAPEAYREDLVIQNEGKSITMKRFVDHGRSRTEMTSEGQSFVMLEMGDEKGTSYMVMPDEKRAMKQSAQGMSEASKEVADATKKAKEAKSAPPPDIQAEDLGEETLDGRAVKKVRMKYGKDAQEVMGWFDKQTGAPVRMESSVEGKKSVIEWKNRAVEPQPATLFAVPKGYEVTDMDEMMKKMGSMGGGRMPMGGMGMGVGSVAKGMAGGMVQSTAQSFGSNLGGTLGASIGGPLGGIAGQFIGGKIGGMIGKKAANAIN